MEVSNTSVEFKGDFKKPTATTITLSNPTKVPIAFKIKTNAPKVYSVKPNYGILPPSDTINVSITLGTLTQSLPKNYKCNHRFLVMGLPSDGISDVATHWANLLEKYKNDATMNKIKVNYIAEGEKLNGTASNGGKLNGRSQRISKFIANGSAETSGDNATSVANGAVAGGAVAAGAVAAGVAGVAGGAAALAGVHHAKSKHRGGHDNDKSGNNGSSAHPYREIEPSATRNQVAQYDQSSSVATMNGNGKFGDRSSGKFGGKSDAVSGSGGGISAMTLTRFENKLDDLISSNERVAKKMDNLEKLMIIALMLLSFILGKLMV